jgi:hypothetical protein
MGRLVEQRIQCSARTARTGLETNELGKAGWCQLGNESELVKLGEEYSGRTGVDESLQLENGR